MDLKDNNNWPIILKTAEKKEKCLEIRKVIRIFAAP